MSLHMPTAELPLFASARPDDPSFLTAPATPLEARFARFHMRNPQVYRELHIKAAKLLGTGRSRIGIAELVEELRYDHRIESRGEPFRLNNSHRSFYARLLIYRDLRFDGVIETRTLTNARTKASV